jgi:anti-sigma factor RsiW
MTAAHSPTPEALMAYLDGELPAAAAREVLTHLAACERCQRLADDLRGVSRNVRAWQVGDPPSSLQLPHEAAQQPIRERPRAWRLVGSRTLAAAAAAVVLVGTAFLLQPPNRSAPAESGQAMASDGIGVTTVPLPPALTVRVAGRAAGQSQAETPRAAGPSIVRTVTLSITASDFDAVRPAIDRTLRDVGGFVGQLGVSNSGEGPRSIHGTLRVPAARLDEAVAALKTLGRVTTESQEAVDVTEQVVDLDVRIANARITEKRLADLIQNRTGRVSDVLEAEREMARVRTELERLDAQRKKVQEQVAYAMLTLNVVEERGARVNLGPVPVPARLRHAVADGFEAALSSLLQAALIVLGVGPGLLLWAILLGVPGWLIVRRWRYGNNSSV